MKCQKGVRLTHWKMASNPRPEWLSDASDTLKRGEVGAAEK